MGIVLMLVSVFTGPAIEPVSVAEAKTHLRLDSSNTEPAPSTAPTVALAGTGAGNVENGVHRVAVSFVTADGETEPGPLSSPLTVVDKTVNGKIAATAIEIGGSGVTARKVWMPATGTLTPLLLAATIADNTSTTATINLADASLGAQAPTANTTADPDLTGRIVSAREQVEADTGRALITQVLDVSLDGWPSADGYVEVPRPPLQSLTVSYVDGDGATQTWASTNYRVIAPSGQLAKRGRVYLAYGMSLPTFRDQSYPLTFRITAGYGATRASVPRSLWEAMLLLIGDSYWHRESTVVGTIAQPMPRGYRSKILNYISRSETGQ